ncbi:hypothetical protein [Elizabethkingia ursingii]
MKNYELSENQDIQDPISRTEKIQIKVLSEKPSILSVSFLLIASIFLWAVTITCLSSIAFMISASKNEEILDYFSKGDILKSAFFKAVILVIALAHASMISTIFLIKNMNRI